MPRCTLMTAAAASVVALALTAGCSASAGQGSASQAPPDGKQVIEDRCTICHTTDRILAAKHTPAEWDATVARMEGKGLSLTPQQRAAVLKYLSSL